MLDAGPNGERVEVVVHALNIFEIFAAIHSAGVAQFMVSFLGDHGLEGPTQFWSAAKKSPVYARFPNITAPLELLSMVVPFLIFYDGADIFRDKEYLWILASSAVATSSSEWDAEFPLLCIPGELVKNPETMHMLFTHITRWIKWNFKILQAGVGPSKGFYGEPLATASMRRYANQPLAGQWKGAWVGNIGDFKAKKEWQGYSRYYRCRFLCEACLGESPTARSDKTFTAFDFNDDAKWLETILPTQLIEEMESHTLPLAQMDGWDSEMYHRDTAHTNELGQSKDSCACCVISLLEEGLLASPPDTDPDTTLRKLHQEFDDFCIDNGIQKVSAVKLSMRTVGRGDGQANFPELSSHWKASPTRVLTYFLAEKCRKVCHNSGYQKIITTHMWAMAEFTWVCRHAGIEMQPLERDRALRAGRLYLLTLQGLCNIAKAKKSYLWRMRPKNHYFAHILHTLARSPLNPDVFSCLRRESMLGKLKHIGKSCSKLTVTKTALVKYLIVQTSRIRVRKQFGKFVVGSSDRSYRALDTATQSRFEKYKLSLDNARRR